MSTFSFYHTPRIYGQLTTCLYRKPRTSSFSLYIDLDYLQSKKWMTTVSEGGLIAEAIGIKTRASNLILDGGNVVKANSKAILCEKLLKENRTLTKIQVLAELANSLGAKEVILVPQQPGDFIGHSDGMIRFLDERTVLINDYSREKASFRKAFEAAIKGAGLKPVTMPYNPYQNRTNTHANGTYINYLQMENLTIMPIFGLKEDDEAAKLTESLFPGC